MRPPIRRHVHDPAAAAHADEVPTPRDRRKLHIIVEIERREAERCCVLTRGIAADNDETFEAVSFESPTGTDVSADGQLGKPIGLAGLSAPLGAVLTASGTVESEVLKSSWSTDALTKPLVTTNCGAYACAVISPLTGCGRP